MFGKINKENLIKIITALIIASIALLSISILTNDNDSRRQILDKDGGTETNLCSILSDIKGVGEVNVMVEYDDDDSVKGVIVTAQGASNPIVKNNLTNAVATLFKIPVSNVVVFEKDQNVEKE
ncbi:MAG: hypothetical protein RR313_00305 [Anaerovoracaceae bacterium]